jgi:hypothetical protein
MNHKNRPNNLHILKLIFKDISKSQTLTPVKIMILPRYRYRPVTIPF